jgi:hypothetical protein
MGFCDRISLRAALMKRKITPNGPEIRGMSAKRILSLVPLVILMLCVTQHFAIAQRRQVGNGQCGAANGVAVSVAPTTNLCTSGTASAVRGSGPWTWKCNGSRAGSSASCSAPVGWAFNPPPPPGAEAAGFTTLALNSDFTQLQPSNWLDCFPQDDSSGATWWQGYWYENFDGGQPPCEIGNPGPTTSSINIVTDPVYGNQALDLTWKASYGGADQGYTEIQTLSSDGTTSNGGAFPLNHYFEVIMRTDNTPSMQTFGTPPAGADGPMKLVGGSWMAAYEWTVAGGNPSGATGPVVELDNHEDHGDFPNKLSMGGYFNWNAGGCPDCGASFIGNVSGFDPTVYNTYGFRVTSDGSTGMATCGYLNDNFMGCTNVTGLTASQFVQRQFLILINGIGCNFFAGDNSCQNATIQDFHDCSGSICIDVVTGPGAWDGPGNGIVEPCGGAYASVTGATGISGVNGPWMIATTNCAGGSNEWQLENSTWPGGGQVNQSSAVLNAYIQTDMYVQSVRVWSCPSWATTECNGPILDGPP